MSQQAQWSADGQWWWNGQQWVPAAQAASQGAPPPPEQPATPPVPPAQPTPYAAPAPVYATSPQAAPRTSHTGRNLGILGIGCAGIIVLILGLALIGALTNHGTTAPSTPAAGDSNSAVSSPSAAQSSAPATSAPAAQPQVLLDKKGNGINKTATFTAAGAWEIDYSFDCSNFGQAGNFAVIVYNSDGSPADLPVNSLALKGQDVSHEAQGGSYYLEIDSECNWHVVVKG